MGEYRRITKEKAQRLYMNGHGVYVCASKRKPLTGYGTDFVIDPYESLSFEGEVDYFKRNFCNSIDGRGVAFYEFQRT